MKDQRARYPDISDILSQKAAGRIHNASVSFAVKLDILETLKERASLFIKVRKAREAKKAGSHLETTHK